jgi:hypothetical protein
VKAARTIIREINVICLISSSSRRERAGVRNLRAARPARSALRD